MRARTHASDTTTWLREIGGVPAGEALVGFADGQVLEHAIAFEGWLSRFRGGVLCSSYCMLVRSADSRYAALVECDSAEALTLQRLLLACPPDSLETTPHPPLTPEQVCTV